MVIEYDAKKDILNREKHGISFAEASEVFNDPLHLSFLDERVAYLEERWISVGQTEKGLCLVVANLFFSREGEEIIRIISAREASAYERKQYEEA